MTSYYTLEILCENETVKQYYSKRSNFEDDAGVDLYCPTSVYIGCNQPVATMIDYKIKCRMLDESGNQVSYYLYPRSSIAKTPLLLANSVGIVDSSYRGTIKAAFRNTYLTQNWIHGESDEKEDYGYTIQEGERLVQICGPTLLPIKLKLVDSLDTTERGEGGFGSTGKGI
jgi:dUTP pyrophosphatase